MKEIIGTIKHISYDNNSFSMQTSDLSIAFSNRDKNGDVWCKGIIDNLVPGLPVKCTGDWEYKSFVYQKIDTTWINLSTTTNFLKRYKNELGLTNGLITEIVERYGRRLFSMDKIELLNQMKQDFETVDPGSLTAVVNIMALKDKALCELEDYLLAYSVSEERIRAIYDFYKNDSMSRLKNDPYKVCSIFEIPFTVAERIAFDTKMDAYDDIRIKGLIRETLTRAGSCGHTCLTPKNLADNVSRLSLSGPFVKAVPALLVSFIVITQKEFIFKDELVSLYYLYRAEKDVSKILMSMKRVKPFTTITDNTIRTIEKDLNVTYGADQKKAFKMLETGGVNILTGGPGTGKTTVINGIIRQISRVKPSAIIELCAPTGRAAKRLSESTGREAKTIHKLCNVKPYVAEEQTSRMEVSQLDADFVICDEFSMVGAELAAILFKSLKQGARIILVGDENQLPSIEPGNILHDLIASGKFPVYRLEENFRQNNGGSIYPNSVRILEGQLPERADDFEIYKAKDEKDSYEALCYFMNQYYNKDNPYETQLIEPSHKGTAGVFRMNNYVYKNIVHKDIKDKIVDCIPRKGDKIIFTKTEKDLTYVNGDVGVIEEMSNANLTINLEGNVIHTERKAMRDFTLDYSHTIHKSQGSEYQTVIIYLPIKMKHMMTKSLFYTAVTRAKKKVIVLYEDNSLEYCINNTSDMVRNTRLLGFLS